MEVPILVRHKCPSHPCSIISFNDKIQFLYNQNNFIANEALLKELFDYNNSINLKVKNDNKLLTLADENPEYLENLNKNLNFYPIEINKTNMFIQLNFTEKQNISRG